ncbi:carbohydrate kinase family protein [Magnetospira sp. QH-2]|uniref:carbohydrate kinase family protein n=1 Tax=Magnetospira sp. (strain QH-2) TaxID=1288970 RepID=UPI0003E812CB|nr:PfkB family carbohydrate kinase [Magnetospira sp. QH-2]CCQ72839.1 putative sugars and pyrimidines kinase, PfkB family protein [Magnetospira sp. QH-2]
MDPILVVGSVAVDEVVRLQAPLRIGSHNAGMDAGARIGGGAANTAMALARAGDSVSVVSAVGEDEAGALLLDQLARLGVDLALVDRHAGETTRSLIMLEEAGERTIVNRARAPVALPADLASRPASAFYVRSADPLLTEVIQERSKSCPVLAHVPPMTADFRPAQVLVASESDLDPAFLHDPWQGGRRIAGETLEWMVLTRGERGAAAFDGKQVIEVGAPNVSVIDSTGAGDVFAAGLLHGLARGYAMGQCLETAVSWGSASVGYEGTMPPHTFPA